MLLQNKMRVPSSSNFMINIFFFIVIIIILTFCSRRNTLMPVSVVEAADGCFNCRKCRCNGGTFSACVDCPAGRACDGLYADCCVAGKFAPPASCTCTFCSPGTYQDLECQGSCKKCPAGTRNPNSASTVVSACTNVPAGYFSPEGASDGTACPAGTFCRFGGCMNSCSPCPINHYQTYEGQSSCSQCRAGTDSRGLTSQTSITTCQPCPSGQYNPSPGGSCQNCLAGRFCAAQGLSVQTLCLPGTFSAAGATVCTSCPINTFAASSGAANFCTKCPRGTMTDAIGQTSCRPCYVNTFNDIEGGFCKWCPKGHWTNGQTGQATCTKCPAPGCTLSMSLSESLTSSQSFSESIGSASSSFEISASSVSLSSSSTFSPNTSLSSAASVSNTQNSKTKSFSSEDSLSISSSETEHTESASSSKYYTRSTNSRSQSPISDSISFSGPANMSFTTSASETSSHVVHPSESETIPPSESVNTPSLSASPSEVSPSTSQSYNESSLSSSRSYRTPSSSFSTTRELTNVSITHSKQSPTISREDSTSLSSTIRVIDPPPLGLSAEAQQAIQTSSNIVSGAMAVAAAPAALAVQRGLAVLQLIGCPPRDPTSGKKWTESNIPFPASLIPGFGWGDNNGWFNRGAIISFFGLVLTVCVIGLLNTETIGTSVSLKAKKKKNNIKKRFDADDDDDDDDRKNNKKCCRKSSETIPSKRCRKPSIACQVVGGIKYALFAEEYHHNREDDELIDQEQERELLNSSDREEEKNDDVESQNEGNGSNESISERAENENSNKQPPPQKVSRVSMMVMACTSVLIGMWSPQAGLLFTAWTPEDFALSLAPLIAVLVFGLSICIRIHKSLVYEQKEGRGIIFVKSYILEKKCGLGVSHRKWAPKSILQSPPGRFCLLGEYFWSRPRGVIGRDAQILLSSLGSQLQKFRGPTFAVDWVQTEDPLAHWDDENTKLLEEERKRQEEKSIPGRLKKLFGTDDHQKKKKSGRRHNDTSSFSSSSSDDNDTNQYGKNKQKKSSEQDQNWLATAVQENENDGSSKNKTHLINDWEEIEEPLIRQKDHSLSSYIAPHYLVISWFFSASVGFLSGVARGMPDKCPTLAKVMCFLNIASFIVLVWLRPFVIPMRNYINLVLDGVVAVSSLLASILLVSSSTDDDGDDPRNSPLMGFAISLQVSMTFVAMTGAFFLIGGTIVRFLLLRCGECSVATQEDMWAKQKIKLVEECGSFFHEQETGDDDDNHKNSIIKTYQPPVMIGGDVDKNKTTDDTVTTPKTKRRGRKARKGISDRSSPTKSFQQDDEEMAPSQQQQQFTNLDKNYNGGGKQRTNDQPRVPIIVSKDNSNSSSKNSNNDSTDSQQHQNGVFGASTSAGKDLDPDYQHPLSIGAFSSLESFRKSGASYSPAEPTNNIPTTTTKNHVQSNNNNDHNLSGMFMMQPESIMTRNTINDDKNHSITSSSPSALFSPLALLSTTSPTASVGNLSPATAASNNNNNNNNNNSSKSTTSSPTSKVKKLKKCHRSSSKGRNNNSNQNIFPTSPSSSAGAVIAAASSVSLADHQDIEEQLRHCWTPKKSSSSKKLKNNTIANQSPPSSAKSCCSSSRLQSIMNDAEV